MKSALRNIIFIALVSQLAACALPEEERGLVVENNKDVSSLIVSESDLLKNGCSFKRAAGQMRLECVEKNEIFQQYAQKASVLRYSKNYEAWLEKGEVKLSNGQIVNEKSMRLISDKGMASIVRVHQPDASSFSLKSITKLYVSNNLLEGDRVNKDVLEFLLRLSVNYDVTPYLSGETIKVDCSRCVVSNRDEISSALRAFLSSSKGKSTFKTNVVSELESATK